MKDSEFPTVNRPGKNPGLEVSRLNKPGLYAVGGGLYLRVQKGGAKSWQYRFSFDNHIYTMGLGRLEILTLDKARKQAIVLTGQRLSGINPWAIRQTTKVKSVAESKRLSPRRSRATAAARHVASPKATMKAPQPGSFREAGMAYVAKHITPLDFKTLTGWQRILSNHVYPVIGDVPLKMIDLELVKAVLDPIWFTKTETADRARRYIERILGAAIFEKKHPGPNFAVWQAGLKNIYPSPTKVAPIEHRKMMPYAEVPAFMLELRACDGTSSHALEFLILTASRPETVRLMTWAEVDAKLTTWDCPAEHMKGGLVGHRVPLSAPARGLLRALEAGHSGDLVFPGPSGAVMSDATMNKLLNKQLGKPYDPHGFRASFDTWAQNETEFTEEVRDRALAHGMDKVTKTYRRGDQFKQRIPLMEAWGRYCAGSGGELVQFKRGA